MPPGMVDPNFPPPMYYGMPPPEGGEMPSETFTTQPSIPPPTSDPMYNMKQPYPEQEQQQMVVPVPMMDENATKACEGMNHPHPVVQQGPPGANLFIFHLPNEWNDYNLYEFFEQFKFGPIVSVRIMTEIETGKSKGFGFVSYDHPDSAANAIKQVNGMFVMGKRLKVMLKKGDDPVE